MSKPERAAGRRSNVRQMSVKTRQNTSKHVKTCQMPSWALRQTPPTRQTRPSLWALRRTPIKGEQVIFPVITGNGNYR